MKIKKLEKDLAGRFEVTELFYKVNEIIDFLNNSFITNDPDTVYGQVDESILMDHLSCDRLTPFVNETTDNLQKSMDFEVSQFSVYSNIKCPKCGAKYFTVGPSVSTCVYYPPIIKDGVNINPDRNKCTTHYECLECGHKWSE